LLDFGGNFGDILKVGVITNGAQIKKNVSKIGSTTDAENHPT
jgi:hypothetical protein